MANVLNKEILDEDINYCVQRSYMNGFVKKKVLVIGASGMIGGFITRVLSRFYRKNDGTVLALCRYKKKLENSMEKDFRHNIFLEGDVLTGCKEIRLPEIDIGIYAAGYTDREIFLSSPESIYRVNTEGLLNMLKIATKSGCKRFVYISSASVYGEIFTDKLQEGQIGYIDFTNHQNVYAESKRMGECICNCYARQFDVDIRIVRPFHMYGPGMKLNNTNLVETCIKKALAREDIILKSDGRAKRNYTYLRDMICQLLMSMVFESGIKILNLGSNGNNLSVADFAAMVGKLAEVKVLYDIEDACNKSVVSVMCPDLTKTNEMIKTLDKGMKSMSLQKGLERTLHYYGLD